ncbi:helix-turn-helix domain-containing protein [Vagococcus sp.]|uniref:helix-turn-helix domain-containing protein n=1 Tax=Vagococcus sp. TaxID=1933889 RepID=UPI003F97E183
MQIISDQFTELLMENITSQVDKSIRLVEKQYAVRSRYLNKQNACVYADISAPTLDKWVAEGLPIAKINKCFRIDTKDIDKFIEEHTM